MKNQTDALICLGVYRTVMLNWRFTSNQSKLYVKIATNLFEYGPTWIKSEPAQHDSNTGPTQIKLEPDKNRRARVGYDGFQLELGSMSEFFSWVEPWQSFYQAHPARVAPLNTLSNIDRLYEYFVLSK